MKTITTDFVDELVDFAPSEADKAKGFARQQRDGTVALFNMLAQNRCAYLADEVGMGKTYVALAIMCLLRYFDPQARIIVIAPRENIQHKWVKELQNFVRVNWKVTGNRVKAIQGGPVWEPVVCHNLVEFAREAMTNQDRDFFLRMTSFSLAVNDPERRQHQRKALCRVIPWLKRRHIDVRTPDSFRVSYGQALNGAVPTADLVIFDEAHNLKHGFSTNVSTRNRIMGFAFGRPVENAAAPEWYAPRAKRVLLLSATPFEEEYGAIQRQLNVFGFGNALLTDANGREPLPIQDLADSDSREKDKRRVLERMLVRRASGLLIGGDLHTKNMYRREWRRGGFELHDKPLCLDDPEQRLVVALMQKKVTEVLQSERFQNSFQIGMLSSFESFLESVGRMQRKEGGDAEAEEEAGTFDGEDQNRRASKSEKQGIDTEAIRRVVRSYRERFGRALPHPKLDATAQAHEDVFDSGEKVLIFVRRVATVNELASKLEEAFDSWIRTHMERALPNLGPELDRLFLQYERERLRRPEETGRHLLRHVPEVSDDATADPEEPRTYLEDDEGGAESFFAWFFRGQGPAGLLSGGAFQKNRLSSTSSAFATLFEDDYVARLLNAMGKRTLPALADALGQPLDRLAAQLRPAAFSYFRERSRRAEGYPRLYVFEGYQVAGLRALAAGGNTLAEQARQVLEERYPEAQALEGEGPPSGFPGPEVALGATTIFTEIAARPGLLKALWPDEFHGDFRFAFRRREQRRELLSAMARLGAAYIDLYLIAIRNLGGFTLGAQADERDLPSRLAREYVALLEKQAATPGFHAYRELALAAQTFDLILAVNFPDVPDAKLPELARIYGQTLQKQVPVGRMAGGVNKRLVRQFRMPGFPLALVTTDVLQEGEDLHTFCKRVVHYGITWTSSAMEQRTGRIDRIGGLVQRHLDGSADIPDAKEFIQVHFPHLRDTVEVIQVRRVLRRMNRFLVLMHRNITVPEDRDSHIDAARAMLEELEDVPPITHRLESAFPVRGEWLQGVLGAKDVVQPQWDQQFAHFHEMIRMLKRSHAVVIEHPSNDHHRLGVVQVDRMGHIARDGDKSTPYRQDFTLALRSQIAGDATLLRCTSRIGLRDLRSREAVDALVGTQRALGYVKICMRPRVRQDGDDLFAENDILFDPHTTRLPELISLLERTAGTAAALQHELDVHDNDHTTMPQADLDRLLLLVDALIDNDQLPWRRRGHVVDVTLQRLGRRQHVRLSAVGDAYRFASVVTDVGVVARSAKAREELARRIWIRNTLKAVIGFAFDDNNNLIGFVDEPSTAMYPTELRFYIETVATECDRLEFILTGRDAA